MVERLRREGPRTAADVVITVGGVALLEAAAADVLQSAPADVRAAVPSGLQDPEGRWVAISTRVRGLAHHLERAPADTIPNLAVLAGPDWAGRVLSRAGGHPYSRGLAAGMTAAIGTEAAARWVKGVYENFARIPEGNDTDQIRAIAAEIGDVAFVNHYYLARLAASPLESDRELMKQIGFLIRGPTGAEPMADVSAAAVTRHAPHPDAAAALMRFLLSAAGQRMLADLSFELPVNPAVTPHPLTQALGVSAVDKVDAAAMAKAAPAATQMMEAAGWR